MKNGSESDDRERVAKACRILGKLDLTKAATGHVSQRGADGRILIRARGPDELGVRYTTANEVIAVDINGKKLDGPDGLVPPQEVFIHTAVYRKRPEVKAVIHIHPPKVVIFTITNVPLQPIFGAYDPSGLNLILDGIPTYGRSITITDDQLGAEFMQAMGDKRVCLMKGHGITTAGATLEEATVTAIKINELAEMHYHSYVVGKPEVISDEDIAHFKAKVFRKDKGPSVHLNPTWRYYATLVGE
jgi:ribulose-5-phosphate 4-epimerase/fuculose-1-phosphate aldolase